MADQQSRGGKKQGGNDPQEPEKHQDTGPHTGREGTTERPGEGQPGGPKPNSGKSRPQS